MQSFHFHQILVAASSLIFSTWLCAADSMAPRNAALLHRGEPVGSNTTGPLDRPVLGYVLQAQPLELRAIFGVPGSAVLSDPLSLPQNATRLHLPPGQGYALVERSAGDPVVLPLGAIAASTVTIPGALQKADFAAFSPKGQSVVLYSNANARLQVITGLPEAPLITWDVNTGAFAEQPLEAAISDDSGTVLLTSADVVYQLLPGSILQQLVSVDGAAALTFLPNSSQAAIADRGAGVVYLWQRNGSTKLLTGGLTGVGEIRPTGDGQGLWLTNPAANAVSWLSINSAELSSFSVPITPSKLEGLPYRDMFLIASESGQPVWFLFQQGGQAQAAFVPVVRDKKPLLPGPAVRK